MSTVAPAPSPLARRTGPNVGLILGVVGIVVLALLSFVVILLLGGQVGDPIHVAIAGSMALIPLGFVIWALLAIDRWEPEPRVALWFAALWGGVAAVLLTVIVNSFVLEPLIVPFLPSQAAYEFYAVVIQAPVMEELWKGIPVAIMLLCFPRTFDGPVDGIVIAGLSAAGFAFSENIQYFGMELAQTGGGSFIFFLRGVMSPLTHVIFTAVGIGLALGLAARLGSRWWILLAWPLGHAVSTGLHALWNSASWWVPGGPTGFFVYYLVVQVPLCLIAAGLVWLLLRQEVRLTRTRLDDYGRAGWFTAEEVQRLSSGDGRAALMRWAKRRGLGRTMEGYIRTATRLANHRQRALTGRDRLRSVAGEAELLADLLDRRRRMATTAMGAPVQIAPGAPMAMPVAHRVQRFGDLQHAHPQQPWPQRAPGQAPSQSGWLPRA